MGGLVVAALFFVVFWFLIIRPNQRRMRAHQALLATLEVGDEVLTSSGIYGRIIGLDDDLVQLEVAPTVVLRMARGAIARRLVESYPDDDAADDRSGPDAHGSES